MEIQECSPKRFKKRFLLVPVVLSVLIISCIQIEKMRGRHFAQNDSYPVATAFISDKLRMRIDQPLTYSNDPPVFHFLPEQAGYRFPGVDLVTIYLYNLCHVFCGKRLPFLLTKQARCSLGSQPLWHKTLSVRGLPEDVYG